MRLKNTSSLILERERTGFKGNEISVRELRLKLRSRQALVLIARFRT